MNVVERKFSNLTKALWKELADKEEEVVEEKEEEVEEKKDAKEEEKKSERS